MKTKDNEQINVIILRNRVHQCKEEVIEDYIDILKGCKTAQDFYALFDQFYDDVFELAAELFIEKQIQQSAETLEKIRRF